MMHSRHQPVASWHSPILTDTFKHIAFSHHTQPLCRPTPSFVRDIMEAIFEVDNTREVTIPTTPTRPKNENAHGVSHPTIVETPAPKVPTFMKYVKEELEIVRFQPTTAMIWNFIGDRVDSLCGVDKSMALELEPAGKSISGSIHTPVHSNTSPSSLIPFDNFFANTVVESEDFVTTWRKAVTPEHNHVSLSDVQSADSVTHSSKKVVPPPPPSIVRVNDFKHIQLPHSILMMAAAYDMQHTTVEASDSVSEKHHNKFAATMNKK